MDKNEWNIKIGFNNVTATTGTLPGQCYSYEIYTNDDSIYVDEDEVATAASYRVPQNTISERIIPCKTISVLGVGGNGLAEIKAIPLLPNGAITDDEVYATIAPVK